MDPPSGRVPERGPDWFLVATEACGSGTPDLGLFLGVSIFIVIFGVGFMSGGGPRVKDQGGAPSWGAGRALHPRGWLRTLLAHLRCSVGFFWSENKFREISGQLDSVCFSCSPLLKNKEKTETGTGL